MSPLYHAAPHVSLMVKAYYEWLARLWAQGSLIAVPSRSHHWSRLAAATRKLKLRSLSSFSAIKDVVKYRWHLSCCLDEFNDLNGLHDQIDRPSSSYNAHVNVSQISLMTE
jgi:hypothetical protein